MIFRSPHPDVDVPDIALHRFVLERAAELGEKPALIDGPSGRTLTYAQVARGADGIAAGLAARGLRKGQVVGLFMPNLCEFALAFHGTLAAGGVVTTVNSLATQKDLQFQLRDSGTRFLVTIPPFLDRAAPAAKEVGIEDVFVIGEPAPAGTTPFADLLETRVPAPRVSIDPRQDVAALPYSSGTTGFPKGVMLTRRNLVANLLQCQTEMAVTGDDRMIAVLPFFHIYGMNVIVNLGLWRGATLVTMPRFELEPFLSLLEQHRVTLGLVAPPMVLALAKHPVVEGHDLSALRRLFSGAAPLDADLEAACTRRLGCAIQQGYGLTEASPATHMRSCEPGKHPAGTVGPPVPNTECRIVDVTTGRDLGSGEGGEVLVRGPQVMKGYLNNEEATKASIDSEGWLHTGDIGQADQRGCLTIVDRLKELIKYKGFQVPPAELEAVLCTHPAVADAAVIPQPDEECCEVPKAFVVLKGKVSGEELIAYVAERVAPYKKVRAVEMLDAIPKSPSGKILRRVLKERDRAARY